MAIPEDPELEQFVRDQKKKAHEKEDALLPEAKLAFKRFVESEQDEIKREKLEEFLHLVETANDLEDIRWFYQKAIQTAAASRQLADKEIAEEKARLERRNQVFGFWFFGIVLCTVILLSGFGKVYYGVLPDGTQMEMESELPETVYVDKVPVKLMFDHNGYAFINQVAVRLIAAGVVLIVCGVYTVSKDIF